MDAINDMFNKGLASSGTQQHQVDGLQLCAWQYLDGKLCNRRALRAKTLIATNWVREYQGKN